MITLKMADQGRPDFCVVFDHKFLLLCSFCVIFYVNKFAISNHMALK